MSLESGPIALRTQEGRLEISGGMTLECATRLLAEGREVVARQDTVADLAAVDSVDSSALAVIFGWMREAQKNHRAFKLENPPAQLLSLAQLYGVAELLPL
jgi:phospholipid transport system transporter-binding protein